MSEKIVCVKWMDTTSEPGWFPKGVDEALIKPLTVYSVGFLVKKTKSHIHLAQLYAKSENHDDERYGGQEVIPVGTVISMRILK